MCAPVDDGLEYLAEVSLDSGSKGRERGERSPLHRAGCGSFAYEKTGAPGYARGRTVPRRPMRVLFVMLVFLGVQRLLTSQLEATLPHLAAR
jgi:hypothetical protein